MSGEPGTFSMSSLSLAAAAFLSPFLPSTRASFHSARSQGATLKLVSLGAKFKEVLQVTKLMTVFDTYENEATALASFQ